MLKNDNKGDTKMRDATIENNIKKILEEDLERVEKFDTEKGGIYVETTSDPRGWMLGDKTRKIYKVSSLIVKALTDLVVIVSSNNDDGSEIKVSVYNPEDIGRMLLSKNDDVGSSIQYASIEPPKPVELVAKIGNHICVESLMKGSWIRALIFPGENIVKIVKNDESEMLKLVESTEIDMKKVLVRLISIYRGAEEEINAVLSRMERHGKICNCEEPLIFKQVYEGKFDDVLQTCLNCGGTVER